MDQKAITEETRLVATFTISGHKRRLWVAPTKKGGYCYEYEHLGGGCKNTPRDRGHIDLNGSYVLRPGATAPVMEKLAGEVFDPEATALRVEFEDGRAFPGAFRLRL